MVIYPGRIFLAPSNMKKTLLFCLILSLYGCGKDQSDQKNSNDSEEIESVSSELKPSKDSELQYTEEKNGNGIVISSGYLKDGKKESSWATYSTGQTHLLKTLTNYVNDKKEGLYLEFNDGNQLIKKCTYRNDVRHGEYREYHYSNLKEERFYQNGKQEGTTKVYYETGKLMEEGVYKNGLREGISKWYDEQGNLTIEYEYRNGQLVKK